MEVINGRDIIKISSQSLDFSTKINSYSPMFSTIGLQASEELNGIDEFYLHYNRATHTLCKKLFDFPFKLSKKQSDICGLVFGEESNARLSFFDTDAFIFETDGTDKIQMFDNSECDYWIDVKSENQISIHGYSKNNDARDPDEKVGFSIDIKTDCGEILCEENSVFLTSENKKIQAKIFVQALKICEEKSNEILDKNLDFYKAKSICENWFLNYTKDFKLNVKNEAEAQLIAKAVFGLLFNTAQAQGILSKYLSAFPSRGGYPSHFIWDTYFQNLAYEKMNLALAEDFLLQIIENQRPDGKFPQFMCSTWARPHDSQPALFGWAAKRFLSLTDNRKDFILKIVDGLERNNQWWLSQRMTKYGCIFCPSGLETGQDDSPRFDNGATLAVDMNAYLLNQLKFTAEIFDEIGDKNKAKYWSKKSELLNKNIIENLYDNERNIFFDFSLTENKPIKIISPSSLLPLWAGIKLDNGKERKMIESYLINPDFMFSDVPFPSIAYNESEYDPEAWWRGPTWPSIAWLMLEILENYGYDKEYKISVERLYKVLFDDREMHELFNSQSGEGMGNVQQGWSCAIFIKLCEILNN